MALEAWRLRNLERCRVKARVRMAKLRETRRRLGLCAKCGLPTFDDLRHCADCLVVLGAYRYGRYWHRQRCIVSIHLLRSRIIPGALMPARPVEYRYQYRRYSSLFRRRIDS